MGIFKRPHLFTRRLDQSATTTKADVAAVRVLNTNGERVRDEIHLGGPAGKAQSQVSDVNSSTLSAARDGYLQQIHSEEL